MKFIKNIKYKNAYDRFYHILKLKNNVNLTNINNCLSSYKILINVY